jgi:hypothetical protein
MIKVALPIPRKIPLPASLRRPLKNFVFMGNIDPDIMFFLLSNVLDMRDGKIDCQSIYYKK